MRQRAPGVELIIAGSKMPESVARLAAGDIRIAGFVPDLADRGVRKAMFYVLVGARMPAVLVEASFLTYEPEARALTKPKYRRALADGIASGIASYLHGRDPQ